MGELQIYNGSKGAELNQSITNSIYEAEIRRSAAVNEYAAKTAVDMAAYKYVDSLEGWSKFIFKKKTEICVEN